MNRLLNIVLKLAIIASILLSLGATPNRGSLTLNTPDIFSYNNGNSWDDIGYTLTHTNYHTYVLNWRGIGGKISVGQRFIKSIEEAQAQGKEVIIKLQGGAYSMHALVACYANHVVYSNNFLMFHADAGLSRVRTERESEIKENLRMCISRGILRQSDYSAIYASQEVYRNNSSTWYQQDRRNH